MCSIVGVPDDETDAKQVKTRIRAKLKPYCTRAAGVIPVDALPQIISELCHVDIPPNMFKAFMHNAFDAPSSPLGTQPIADTGNASDASNAIVIQDSKRKLAAAAKYQERIAVHEASDRETLLSAVVSAEMTIDADRSKFYAMARSREYYKKKCDDVVVLYDNKQDELDRLREQTCFRPGVRNISKYGGYTLAIQAATSAASTTDTVQLVAGGEPAGGFKSPHIVTKYMQRLFAAVRMKSKDA